MNYSVVQPTLPSQVDVALGCTVNTFGFGSDHDPNLLKGISEAGSGIYYYIQNTDNIPEAFADCLGGLLSVAGQNISLKIEAQNDSIISKLITKYSITNSTNGKSYELNIGDIQSDEQKDILFSASLPTVANEATEFIIAKLTLTYFNVIDTKLETTTAEVKVQRLFQVPADSRPNFELDKQRNRLLAAEAMEKATYEGNKGNLSVARELLKTCYSRISESISAKDPFCVGLIEDIKKCESNLRDVTTYNQVGQQMLNNNYVAHYMQRSSNVQMQGQQAYQTTSRKAQHANFSQMKGPY